MPTDDQEENIVYFPDDADVIETTASGFTDDYKDLCFKIWYNAGKPGASDLYTRIPFPKTNLGNKPTKTTLNNWVSALFYPRAVDMDKKVEETVNNALVSSKVEMFQRHIEMGRKMQNLAVKYLEGHEDELTASAAVRLLVEGLKIERESISLPGILEKINKMSDEELIEATTKLIQDSDLEIEFDDDDEEGE